MSGLVGNSRRHVFSWQGSFIILFCWFSFFAMRPWGNNVSLSVRRGHNVFGACFSTWLFGQCSLTLSRLTGSLTFCFSLPLKYFRNLLETWLQCSSRSRPGAKVVCPIPGGSDGFGCLIPVVERKREKYRQVMIAKLCKFRNITVTKQSEWNHDNCKCY